MAELAARKKVAMDKKYEHYMEEASDDLLYLLDLSDSDNEELMELRKTREEQNKKEPIATHKKDTKTSNKKPNKELDKKADKRQKDKKKTKKVNSDTNNTTKPKHKHRNSNKINNKMNNKRNSDSLRSKKTRNSTKINNDKRSSDTLNRKKRDSTKIMVKDPNHTQNGRKKRDSIDKKPKKTRDSTKIMDKKSNNTPNGKKKRNSTKINDKRSSDTLHSRKKRNSTKIMDKRSSNTQNQTKPRNSKKVTIKKGSDTVIIKKKRNSDQLIDKNKLKRTKTPIKLNRSKSTKISSIKETKPTKPSVKANRSKSRMIDHKENINKNNGEKAKSKPQKKLSIKSRDSNHKRDSKTSKTNDKRDSKTTKTNDKRDSKTSNKTKDKRESTKDKKKASKHVKRVTISAIKGKDIVPDTRTGSSRSINSYSGSSKSLQSGSSKVLRPGSSRMTRRKTKKLLVDNDKEEETQEYRPRDEDQEEEEKNEEYRPRKDSIRKNDDEDSYEEETEDEEEPSHSKTESSPNIIPSSVAAATKPTKKDEDIKLFKEYDELKRSQWDLGSQVKVYSNSEKAWLKGTVIKVSRNRYYYEDGEWLKLLYHDPKGNELTKSLPRKDKYLKHSLRLKDFKKDKHRERALKYINDNKLINDKEEKKNDTFGGFNIGQKCEYRDRESKVHRWRWCRIFEVSREESGTYVRFEIYLEKGYKQYMVKGFKLLRATIPLKIKSVMMSKWKYLSYRIRQVPELIEARNVHLHSMADFYKRYSIERSSEIPSAVAMLIRSQNVKLFPILMFDVENTLVPTRFIDHINREYDSSERSKLFRNLDDLSNRDNKKHRYKDMRYAQVLGAKMFNIAMRIDFVLKHFCGKMAVISNGGFDEHLQDLICELPDSSGGYIWREIYKKYISQNNQNDEFGLYSAESVFHYECVLHENIMDLRLDTARELAMERFLRAKLMDMEYERLKDDSYYIPVLFAVSEESSFHTAADNAMHKVFESFYRCVCFQLDTENINDDDLDEADNAFLKLMLNNRYIEKIFIKCMKHPYIEPFLKDDVDDKAFEKQTWHKLFSNDQQLHVKEVIKI